MKAKTEVKISPPKKTLKKEELITSLGSCFANEIGTKMQEAGYNISNNPFGVLFNPASIASSLNRLKSGDIFTKEDIILRDPNYGASKSIKTPTTHRPIAGCTQGYNSFYHHGSFSKASPEEFLENANEKLNQAKKHYQNSEHIIITFGTAWVYRHIEKGIIVSNCHKHLASAFLREFLSIEEILNLFRPILTQEKGKNWIFTLSPIRHLKDGLHDNQLSKATLLLAIDQLCKEFPNTSYFPSYEIVLDELRDYRHFAPDLVHPSEETIDYIWKKWKQN